MDVKEFGFADGKVVEVRSTLSIVVVVLIDWQEQLWNIVFENALSIENLNIEGEELERLNVSTQSEYINFIRKAVGEPNAEMQLFEFYTAWGERPRLRIVAASGAVERCSIRPPV